MSERVGGKKEKENIRIAVYRGEGSCSSSPIFSFKSQISLRGKSLKKEPALAPLKTHLQIPVKTADVDSAGISVVKF